MKYHYKMAAGIFIIFMITVLYTRYELELYTWFCENEENGAACFVAHNLYLKEKSPETAKRYLKMSCKLDYEIACDLVNKKNLPVQK